MNAHTAISTALSADATIDTLLGFLPADVRATRVYTTYLTREETPEAFMRVDVDTLWPSIFVSSGGSPKRHPQDYRIPGLTVLYPQVWCYVPTLPGIDYQTVVRRVLLRSQEVLDEMLITDPDTGLNGRLGWFGGVDGRIAEEYHQTWGESSMYQYRARWREEV